MGARSSSLVRARLLEGAGEHLRLPGQRVADRDLQPDASAFAIHAGDRGCLPLNLHRLGPSSLPLLQPHCPGHRTVTATSAARQLGDRRCAASPALTSPLHAWWDILGPPSDSDHEGRRIGFVVPGPVQAFRAAPTPGAARSRSDSRPPDIGGCKFAS